MLPGFSFNRLGIIALADPPAPKITISKLDKLMFLLIRSLTNPLPSVVSAQINEPSFHKVFTDPDNFDSSDNLLA